MGRFTYTMYAVDHCHLNSKLFSSVNGLKRGFYDILSFCCISSSGMRENLPDTETAKSDKINDLTFAAIPHVWDDRFCVHAGPTRAFTFVHKHGRTGPLKGFIYLYSVALDFFFCDHFYCRHKECNHPCNSNRHLTGTLYGEIWSL